MFVTGVTAASSVYGNCIHIEAMEKLMESFGRENNIINIKNVLLFVT